VSTRDLHTTVLQETLFVLSVPCQSSGTEKRKLSRVRSACHQDV